MPRPRSERLLVYTDGRCPFCQWSRKKVEGYNSDRAVEFRDYNDPSSARETPYTDQELATEMHVRTPDGKWSGGFAAWIQVLKALPRWRWLGRLLTYPPLCWAGPPTYRLVARNRYRTPKFLLRWMGAPPPCNARGACETPEAS